MRRHVLVGLPAISVGMASGGTPAGAEPSTGSLVGTVSDASGNTLHGVCVELYAEEYRTAVRLTRGDVYVGGNTWCYTGQPQTTEYLRQ